MNTSTPGSVLCGKTTLDGTPCERLVAQPGGDCGAEHQEEAAFGANWTQGEDDYAASNALPDVDSLLGGSAPNPPPRQRSWSSEAGPRQTRDFEKALQRLDREANTFVRLSGVVGGQEHRTTIMEFSARTERRQDVDAALLAVGDQFDWHLTRENCRAATAAIEAAIQEVARNRPVRDERRSPEEEADAQARLAAINEEDRARRAREEAKRQQVLSKAPPWAKAVILAELRQDRSDPLSDYFSSQTQRTVAIGFRSGTREDFRQLRAAAAQFSETAHMASDEALRAWREANGDRDAADELEHRDNYSMGMGNYLSDHGWGRSGSGWIIRSAPLDSNYWKVDEIAIPDSMMRPPAPSPSS